MLKTKHKEAFLGWKVEPWAVDLLWVERYMLLLRRRSGIVICRMWRIVRLWIAAIWWKLLGSIRVVGIRGPGKYRSPRKKSLLSARVMQDQLMANRARRWVRMARKVWKEVFLKNIVRARSHKDCHRRYKSIRDSRSIKAHLTYLRKFP